MEGYKCHVSYHGVANWLLDRYRDNIEWLNSPQVKQAKKEEIQARWKDIEDCRKGILDLIPDNDKEEEQ